jgi:DNA-binding response OmpR family regulator
MFAARVLQEDMNGRKKKILIVEDDQATAEALAFKLDKAGMDVVQAKNGMEGLAKTRADKPDLILLDVLMPVMDGMEMLKELRRDPVFGNEKVIVLTNKDTDDKMLADIVQNHPAYYLLKANTFIDDIILKVQECLAT